MATTTAPAIRPIPVSRRGIGGRLLRASILILAFLAAGLGGWWAYQNFNRPAAPTTVGTPSTVGRQAIVTTVTGSGQVATNTTAKVNARTAGVVRRMDLVVGQAVTAGDALAWLDTADLTFALRKAENDVASAEARLAALYQNGPTAADLASSQASIRSAQLNVDKSTADRNNLFTPKDANEITVARADLEQKRIDLQKAQSDYDRVSWKADIGIQPEAAVLEKATIAHASSKASFDLKNAAPKEFDVTAADRSIQTAQNSLAQAQANYNKLFPTIKASDVQTNTISVETAKINLEQAQQNLENSVVRAPISGVVSEIRFQPGETASAQMFTIIDPNALKLDLNVDETSVAKTRLGQPATISFDAIPGYTARGSVTAIAPAAVTQQGVSAFPVTITIENPQNIKPGMNGTVSIVTDRKDGVVAVPPRAVRTVGRERQVQVQNADGTVTPRVVTVGVSNDQWVEITSGVQPGETVVVSTAVSTTNRTTVPGQPGGAGGGFPLAPGGGAAVPK